MKKRRLHLGMSGGGFAIPGLAGAAVELLSQDIKPEIISGISSGSIMTFILCGSKDPIGIIKGNAIGFEAKDVFSKPPFNKKGKLTFSAICNAIFNNYLSEQDRLPELLKTLVSETEWYHYRTNPNSPDGIVMAVDMCSGKRIFANLKDYSYEDAITLVQASSSIPVFVKPVYYKDMVLADGGLRNHIITDWIFDNYEIEKSYSVFTRSEDFKEKVKPEDLNTTPKILMRTIDILINEISKSDAEAADLKAELKGIEHDNVFIENILMNVYDASAEKQKQLFELGRSQMGKKI